MTKAFQRYRQHEDVSCFNCGSDLLGVWAFKSGNALGRGAWLQCCEKCRMTTYYDLAREVCPDRAPIKGKARFDETSHYRCED